MELKGNGRGTVVIQFMLLTDYYLCVELDRVVWKCEQKITQYFDGTLSFRLINLTLRLLMSYIYGAPILDVSRSHITMQHSR